MLNPLRSEQEAFRFLLYVAIVMAVIVGVVLLARASITTPTTTAAITIT